MDLSCIISSGDLELYILGLLPHDEAYKVEQLALLFPEIKEELDRISQSLEDLATNAEAAPSPSVKVRLMEKIKNLNAEEQKINTGANAAASLKSNDVKPAMVLPMNTKTNNKTYLLAASVIALFISIGAVVYLLLQNRQSNQQVARLDQQVKVLQDKTSSQQQQLVASTQTLQLWQSNDYRKINLPNAPGKPEALAQVFWNIKTSEVYVSDVSLPLLPPGKQYQLWAIVDGKPVDAGLLSNEKNYVQKMKAFETADAFAITLEKSGGSPTPTMEALYVMAKVS